MVHCQGQTQTSAFRFKHSQVQTVVAQISGRFVKKPWGSGMNQLYFRAPEEEVARMVGTHATVSRSGLSQFSLLQMAVKGKVLVAQSCLTLCDPMDCSLPGSFVHGILQARILEWVAMPSSRGSSLGFEPGSPALQADFFTISATREAHRLQ